MFEEKINHTTDALKFVSFSTISIVCFFVKMPFLNSVYKSYAKMSSQMTMHLT